MKKFLRTVLAYKLDEIFIVLKSQRLSCALIMINEFIKFIKKLFVTHFNTF